MDFFELPAYSLGKFHSDLSSISNMPGFPNDVDYVIREGIENIIGGLRSTPGLKNAPGLVEIAQKVADEPMSVKGVVYSIETVFSGQSNESAYSVLTDVLNEIKLFNVKSGEPFNSRAVYEIEE